MFYFIPVDKVRDTAPARFPRPDISAMADWALKSILYRFGSPSLVSHKVFDETSHITTNSTVSTLLRRMFKTLYVNATVTHSESRTTRLQRVCSEA